MIIIGDVHAKNLEPFRTGINKFFDWLIESYKEETLIFLGDLFDMSSPHNKIKKEITKHLINFKQVYIITGNHDTSRKKGNVLLPLELHSNINIIEDVTEVNIEGLDCLFLPYRYGDIKEEYESLKGNYDYVFTHITPLECAFGGEGIQLNLDGIYIHGHTHIPSQFIDTNGRQHHILGVPLPTRHGEHNHRPNIFEIVDGKINYIEVLKYFTYEDVEYGKEPSSKNNIINVLNAPSIQSVYDNYKDYYIRKAGVKLEESSYNFTEEIIDFSKGDIKDKFKLYAKDNNLSKEVVDCVFNYL